MNTYHKKAVPKVSYRVRRRRYGDACWLIHRNDWYELDEVTDMIWLACEESLSIEGIIKRVSEQFKLPLAESIACTVSTIERFAQFGLLEIPDQDSHYETI